MKAILKYPGSKWALADWIISFFPEHHSYLEPLWMNFEPQKQMSIQDYGKEVVGGWKVR